VDCDFFTYRYDSPVNRAAMPHPVASEISVGIPESENDKANFGNAAEVIR
jgi:hypothetical protein